MGKLYDHPSPPVGFARRGLGTILILYYVDISWSFIRFTKQSASIGVVRHGVSPKDDFPKRTSPGDDHDRGLNARQRWLVWKLTRSFLSKRPGWFGCTVLVSQMKEVIILGYCFAKDHLPVAATHSWPCPLQIILLLLRVLQRMLAIPDKAGCFCEPAQQHHVVWCRFWLQGQVSVRVMARSRSPFGSGAVSSFWRSARPQLVLYVFMSMRHTWELTTLETVRCRFVRAKDYFHLKRRSCWLTGNSYLARKSVKHRAWNIEQFWLIGPIHQIGW